MTTMDINITKEELQICIKEHIDDLKDLINSLGSTSYDCGNAGMKEEEQILDTMIAAIEIGIDQLKEKL